MLTEDEYEALRELANEEIRSNNRDWIDAVNAELKRLGFVRLTDEAIIEGSQAAWKEMVDAFMNDQADVDEGKRRAARAFREAATKEVEAK